MAGKKDVEEEVKKATAPLFADNSASPSPTSDEHEDNDDPSVSLSPHTSEALVIAPPPPPPGEEGGGLKIPTVMLTDKDVADLEQAMRGHFQQYSHLHAQPGQGQGQSPGQGQRQGITSPSGVSYEIEISITQKHPMLITEMLGDSSFPKIWMSQQVIYTLTQGLWGAYFKTESGEDWQMYLIDKRDVGSSSLIPPIVLRTASGRRELHSGSDSDTKSKRKTGVSTNIHLAQHSASLYKIMLQRKCPRVLQVDAKNQKVVTLLV
jgi:hypothetical protein